MKKNYDAAIALYHKKQLKQSLKLFSDIYDINPNYKDISLYIGKIHYFGGKFKEAEEFLDSALAKDTVNLNNKVWSLKVKFALAGDKESQEKVIKLAEDILKKDSANLEVLSLLAKLYFKTGALEKSMNVYKKIISFSDEIALAHFELGKIYKAADIKAESDKHLKIAGILASENANIQKVINNISVEEEKNDEPKDDKKKKK